MILFPPPDFNAHPEQMDALEKALANPGRPLHGYVNSTCACTEHDALDRLERIQCPTLDCARDIAERVPGAELKIHTGASHFLLVQRYEEVMADIQRFLADNSPDTK